MDILIPIVSILCYTLGILPLKGFLIEKCVSIPANLDDGSKIFGASVISFFFGAITYPVSLLIPAEYSSLAAC